MKNNFITMLIIALITSLYSCKEEKNSVWKEQVNEVTLNFPNGNLYLYGKAWGLGGNHEEIILSSYKLNNKEDLKKEEVYTFYSSDIYYKKDDNGLIVYATESETKEPNQFKSNIKVILKRIKTYDDVKEYSENYEKYGLTKFSMINR
ncbi:conserved hypothetical protein [Tenacibaculum litopenaei]